MTLSGLITLKTMKKYNKTTRDRIGHKRAHIEGGSLGHHEAEAAAGAGAGAATEAAGRPRNRETSLEGEGKK